VLDIPQSVYTHAKVNEGGIFMLKRPAFAALAIFGVASLLVGLGLIIYVNYHERAYVFLGLGAACFIGGIAGMIEVGSRTRAALSYGVIAMGMMGIVVGLNYLTGKYGPGPNHVHGEIVIALSVIAILAGIGGALSMQPKGGFAAFSSVIALGLVASAGIGALIAGTIYLLVLERSGHAYPLLGLGAVCLIAGIAWGVYAQGRTRITTR
jgi:hypothetical protein